MPEPVPDAVAALVAAVIEDNPFAPPHRQAVLVVRALRRDGWRVCAPAGRATTDAARTASAQTAAQGDPAVRHQQPPVRPSTENEFTEMRQA